MTSSSFAFRTLQAAVGTSLLGLVLGGCNKQPSPSASQPPADAPPIAALPMAAAAVSPAPPAPPASALPAPPRQIAYAPPPPNQRYRYLDRAYWMGGAFADTPPDYTVDYQGTRPWIWRAENGAYRIVERLPRGERIYYYDAGQDQPFLVRDPDYSYAYDRGELVGMYDADGRELDGALAVRHADEASRYFDRSRELYRAAQYQRRQAAYAGEWAARREQLRAEHRIWQEQEARNAAWQSWHVAQEREEAARWARERDLRLAYAAAVGIPIASSASLPNPAELARRQAAYFASRNTRPAQVTVANPVGSRSAPTASADNHTSPVPPVVKSPAIATRAANNSERRGAPSANATEPQPKAAEPTIAAQAAEAKQKQAAAAQARAAQAAQVERAAAEGRQKQAAAAQARATQAAQVERAAAEAKQKELAAAQAKAAQAAQAEKAAAEAKQKQAAAARERGMQAAEAARAAADAKQKEAAAAQAKAAEAERFAAQAKQKEAAAAQAKTAQAALARKAAWEAKEREAAAAQARSVARAQTATVAPKGSRPTIAGKGAPNAPSGKGKDKKETQRQEQQ